MQSPNAATITRGPFGTADGRQVLLYTLTNRNGLVLKVTNYGATITEFHVPDRDGNLADIVLGFENLSAYQNGSPFFGALVGRVANRIKNAQFELDGKQYTLAANNAPHHLHGGEKGWDKVVWNAESELTERGPALKLTYVSKDGEEGYPGTVTALAVYTLTDDNELRVDMNATTDATTLVNIAHHTYWNLGGFDSTTVADHTLQIHAQNYTPGVDGLVPDGTIRPVLGTPFDFTTAKLVGRDLIAAGGDPVGFDQNWIVDGDPNTLRPVARLNHSASGRTMTLEADQPGVQFYSGNFLDGTLTGKGATYTQHAGLCLETQQHPNSVNVAKWKPGVVLRPGETYTHRMVHRFFTE
jgi:aldose 1-epimerase